MPNKKFEDENPELMILELENNYVPWIVGQELKSNGITNFISKKVTFYEIDLIAQSIKFGTLGIIKKEEKGQKTVYVPPTIASVMAEKNETTAKQKQEMHDMLVKDGLLQEEDDIQLEVEPLQILYNKWKEQISKGEEQPEDPKTSLIATDRLSQLRAEHKPDRNTHIGLVEEKKIARGFLQEEQARIGEKEKHQRAERRKEAKELAQDNRIEDNRREDIKRYEERQADNRLTRTRQGELKEDVTKDDPKKWTEIPEGTIQKNRREAKKGKNKI